MWKRYEDEVPGRSINNIWAAPMSPNEKRYVVQTAEKAIQRCVLMTTDPGDLVFDPTCGSGTTAPRRRAVGPSVDRLRHLACGGRHRAPATDDRELRLLRAGPSR